MHDVKDVAIIPLPNALKLKPGTFTLRPGSCILVDDGAPDLFAIGQELVDSIFDACGVRLDIGTRTQRDPQSGTLLLTLQGANADAGLEGYELDIRHDLVVLRAQALAGLFYGVQTLKQLFAAAAKQYESSDLPIPCLDVSDRPRFRWRGMHFDVSRHFYDVGFIKTYIDYLSELKMNVFHWHLTDDQGWRLQIAKHPRLTEVSAWRDDRGNRYGGFYTHDDVREVLEHARRRFVTVVPEIEMPGHAQAVLAAYPELSCNGEAHEVWNGYGISEAVFCAGNDRTFSILEDVLEEVIGLFPGDYIHVGGDECLKKRWKACSKCQRRIETEGLKDEHGLQSFFMNRIGKFLASRGRRMIGWDEILDSDLDPDAAVMSWRGVEGGQRAARQGHPVVMAPKTYVYFNYKHREGDPGPGHPQCNPLERVYALDPTHDLTPQEAANVLGTQACLWTEYVATPEEVRHMLFPRLFALSEVAWTPQESRDLERFLSRLERLWGHRSPQRWVGAPERMLARERGAAASSDETCPSSV